LSTNVALDTIRGPRLPPREGEEVFVSLAPEISTLASLRAFIPPLTQKIPAIAFCRIIFLSRRRNNQ